MGTVTQAVYGRLANDSTLTGMLGQYDGSPAIFTFEPVPGDSPRPLIVSAGNVTAPTDVPETTKQTYGARITRDIRIFDDGDGSFATLEKIADRVWQLLEKIELPLGDGWGTVIKTRADRPIVGPTDERVYQLIVTITISMSKGGV